MSCLVMAGAGSGAVSSTPCRRSAASGAGRHQQGDQAAALAIPVFPHPNQLHVHAGTVPARPPAFYVQKGALCT